MEKILYNQDQLHPPLEKFMYIIKYMMEIIYSPPAYVPIVGTGEPSALSLFTCML